MKRALLIALVLAGSCKKEAPHGDLPPASNWNGGGSAAPAAPSNPHATADNPHATPDNPHAGMDNPNAGMDNPHGGMANPHGAAVPEQTPPRTPDKLPDGKLAIGPYALAVPADWTVKPITSSMRAADFVLPGKPGAEAELVVFYFGKDGAGGVQDNVDRWVDQFQQADGKSSRDAAKIEKTKFGGQEATFVSLNGRMVATAMGPGPAVDKADQALLAAIVDSPSGPYYFKLVGAKATVDANAKAFRAMLESIKVR